MIPTFPRATNEILELLIPICTFNLNGLVEITHHQNRIWNLLQIQPRFWTWYKTAASSKNKSFQPRFFWENPQLLPKTLGKKQKSRKMELNRTLLPTSPFRPDRRSLPWHTGSKVWTEPPGGNEGEGWNTWKVAGDGNCTPKKRTKRWEVVSKNGILYDLSCVFGRFFLKVIYLGLRLHT